MLLVVTMPDAVSVNTRIGYYSSSGQKDCIGTPLVSTTCIWRGRGEMEDEKPGGKAENRDVKQSEAVYPSEYPFSVSLSAN